MFGYLYKHVLHPSLWQVQKVSRTILREPLFNRLMKATVYGQFVGGEDHVKLKGVIDRLKSDGIFPVLDYAVEKDIGDKEVVSLETRYVMLHDMMYITSFQWLDSTSQHLSYLKGMLVAVQAMASKKRTVL